MSGQHLPQYLALLVSIVSLVYLIRIIIITRASYIVVLFSLGAWTAVVVNAAFYIYILFINTAHPHAALAATRSLINVITLGVYIVIAHHIIEKR